MPSTKATQTRLNRLDTQGSDLFSADAGRLASYAASSFIWLGQPKQAVPYAKEAIVFYGEASPAERSPTRDAISRLDLALAYAELDDPEHAASEVDIALASERLTGSAVSRLGDLGDTMNRRYPALDITRAVHEQSHVLAASLGRPGLLSS